MDEVNYTVEELVDELGFDEAARVYADILGVDEQDGRMYLSISLGIFDSDIQTVEATNARR